MQRSIRGYINPKFRMDFPSFGSIIFDIVLKEAITSAARVSLQLYICM